MKLTYNTKGGIDIKIFIIYKYEINESEKTIVKILLGKIKEEAKLILNEMIEEEIKKQQSARFPDNFDNFELTEFEVDDLGNAIEIREIEYSDE